MTSKIFTGDMPELMEIILNNLNHDFDSLYSCALVNRHWCKMAIPILWQDPFSINQSRRESRSSPLFISQYFSILDEDEKLRLKDCGVNAEFSKTLFDYARFLKVLDPYSLEYETIRWYNLELGYDSQNSDFEYERFSDYESDYDSQNSELDHDSQNLGLDYDSQNSELDYNSLSSEPNYDMPINFIINLLLKLFIESGAILHKLNLKFSHFFRIKSEIFCSLRENKQFFSRLQVLYLRTLPNQGSIKFVTPLLKILAKNAMKINTLEIYGFWNMYIPQLFHILIRVIKSQEQLRKFKLSGIPGLSRYVFPKEFYGTISALECQKNSLQEVIIEDCNCNAEFEVLKNCKNLEILRVRHCKNELMKKLNYKVSTLELDYCSIDASTIVQIFEESSILLQRLKFGSADVKIWEESLLGALKSFCPNITYLNLSNIGFTTQLIELLDNLQKLQFLTLQRIVNIPKKERFKQFAKKLPLTLQYLNFDNSILPELYIEVLLIHCNAPLKSLLVDRLDKKKNTKALIEFCLRNRTLNYLNIRSLNKDFEFVEAVEAYVKFVPYERIVVNC